jgi:hypothetical protein
MFATQLSDERANSRCNNPNFGSEKRIWSPPTPQIVRQYVFWRSIRRDFARRGG